MLRALSVILKDDVGAVGSLLQACFPIPKVRGSRLSPALASSECEVRGES